VRSLACGNVQQVKVCSICSLQGHASDMCPTMQEDYIEQANAVDGAFNGQPQRKYDHFSHTYNPGWRDHPNLRYGNQPQQGNQGRQFHPHGFQPQQNYQARQPPPFTNSNVWLGCCHSRSFIKPGPVQPPGHYSERLVDSSVGCDH